MAPRAGPHLSRATVRWGLSSPFVLLMAETDVRAQFPQWELARTANQPILLNSMQDKSPEAVSRDEGEIWATHTALTWQPVVRPRGGGGRPPRPPPTGGPGVAGRAARAPSVCCPSRARCQRVSRVSCCFRVRLRLPRRARSQPAPPPAGWCYSVYLFTKFIAGNAEKGLMNLPNL